MAQPFAQAALTDQSFDRLFPRYVRARSEQFWTPVAVASRAAAIFRARGAKAVLDVGCGPGKFCLVAASAEPDLEVHGVEQRAHLARVGRRLARKLGLPNAHFSIGNAIEKTWEPYDGFYFFNPFAEHTYPEGDRFDDAVDPSTLQFCWELLQVEERLRQARPGTIVVTYHGLGGVIPSSYRFVAEEDAGSDCLRTWVKGPRERRGWAWLETLGGLRRVALTEAHRTLTSVLRRGSIRVERPSSSVRARAERAQTGG